MPVADTVSIRLVGTSLSKQNDVHAENADGGLMVVDTHIHLDLWKSVMTLGLCDVKQSTMWIDELPAGKQF